MPRTLQFRRLPAATLANTTGAVGELIVNSNNYTLTVHDGTTPGGFALLNAATDFDIDQYARNTANTAASSVTIIQGVNVTQNTNITNATNLAQSAYNYANTIVSDTQIDPYARTTANTASNNIIIIQGVNTTQNTNITNATNLAQSAFDSSNNRTVSSLVNGANTVSLGSTGTLTMPTGGRINFDSLSISEAVFYSPNKTVEISSGTSNVQIIATALPGRKTWSFEANGAIVFPDSSVQNTAFTGSAIDQDARNSANAASQTIPQNAQSTNYVLQLTDAGKHIYYTQASNTILHIPTTSNVAFSNGSTIMIVSRTSSGANVTVSPNTGVTMYLAGNTTSASRNVTTYGMATLIQVAANTWFINGTGVS
jgi:hypothetical protein